MANYVNKDNKFEASEPPSRECPHCGAHAQLVPVATPSFDDLTFSRPGRTGMVFRCASCSEPRFVKLSVRSFGDDRVELSSTLVEVERTKERFPLRYLQEPLARIVRETLDCYAANCYNAFASMCRATYKASCRKMGRNAKLRWNELFQDAVNTAGLDNATTGTLETILFGGDDTLPEIGADEAAALIEIYKDMLYQCYVRKAKLRAAMKMRRYFAGESTQTNVTPISRGARRAG